MLGSKLRLLDAIMSNSFLPSCLLGYCTELRHLKLAVRFLDSIDGELFKQQGPALEVLDIKKTALTHQDVSNLAHCVALRRQTLQTSRIHSSLSPLWTSVGLTLCHLVLSFGAVDLALCGFPVLGQVCKLLRTLALQGPWSIRRVSKVLNFLEKHGLGLWTIKLGHGVKLNKAQISAVRAACQSAVIDTLSRRVNTASFLAMGESVSNLNVNNVNDTLPNLDNIGSACPNLLSLAFSVGHVPLTDVRALLHPSKLKLERVELTKCGRSASAAVLQALFEMVSSLTDFKCKVPIFLRAQLVKANPHLRNVHLCFETDEMCGCASPDRALQRCCIDWSLFVAPLLKSDGLSELKCTCFTVDFPHAKRYSTGIFYCERANICVPGRAKKVSVRLCGYQYL